MQTAEQKRQYFRDYDKRRSADPAYRAQKAAKGRAAYLRLREDPKKYALRARQATLRAREVRAAVKGDPVGWLRLLMTSAAARAAKRGLLFTITVADISLPELCPVLGVALIYGGRPQEQRGASLDRLDNSKGYEPGNVRVISWLANRLRSNCDDPAVFEALARDARSRR